MSTIRVDADAVAALGLGLVDLAELLATLDVHAAEAGLPRGQSRGALEELLLGWRHERLALARALDELGRAAGAVGGAYLEVDEEARTALAPAARGRTP